METFWLVIHKWHSGHGIGLEYHTFFQLEQPDISQPQSMFDRYMPGDTIELYGPFTKGRVKERIGK